MEVDGSPSPGLDSRFFSEYSFASIPFARIVRFGQRSLLNRDLFVVSWLLGRFCNYRCSYCWPYARADKKDHRPFALIAHNLDEIKRQARARGFGSFHFSFSGGEPTFHPDYLRILQHVADDCENCNYQSVHMTSNCSQPIAWFEKYAAVTRGLHRVSVTASFHKEFAKRDAFREKLIFLQEKDIQVTVNMVMVPERFDLLWEDAMNFHEAGINVTLKPQSNPDATRVVDGYTEEQLRLLQAGLPQRDFTRARLEQNAQRSRRPVGRRAPNRDREFGVSMSVAPGLEPGAVPQTMQVELIDDQGRSWFIDQAERFNAHGFNRFRGWECSAGFRSIVIREPDGVIKRSYSCSDLPLGTLEDGFTLFPEVKTCQTASCVSSADSKIPKRQVSCTDALWGAPPET